MNDLDKTLDDANLQMDQDVSSVLFFFFPLNVISWELVIRFLNFCHSFRTLFLGMPSLLYIFLPISVRTEWIMHHSSLSPILS